MNRSWNDTQITAFVRDVLGCGCPDSVFEEIAVGPLHPGMFGFDITRIDIGNTLLVYVARPGPGTALRDAVTSVAAEGRRDRDAHGFNRFRFVVAGETTPPVRDGVTTAFARAIDGDEKMHLHFVDAEAVAGL